MSIINPLIKKIISKNKKLKNIYQSQSCYIFGNGYSLKYYDLKKFSNLKIVYLRMELFAQRF